MVGAEWSASNRCKAGQLTMVRLLLIGIGAGVTSALLFATLSTGQAFAVGLFYLSLIHI